MLHDNDTIRYLRFIVSLSLPSSYRYRYGHFERYDNDTIIVIVDFFQTIVILFIFVLNFHFFLFFAKKDPAQNEWGSALRQIV